MTMEESTLALLLEGKEDKHDNRGMAATGIGLAAGLGGAALLAAIIGWVSNNETSKARNLGAMAGIAANTASLGALNNSFLTEKTIAENRLAAERNSRESWQQANQPGIQSYIDVQATPQQTTTASAVADAYALAAAINNNGGLNNAIGSESFLRVQRYSAPQPCGCDSCGN